MTTGTSWKALISKLTEHKLVFGLTLFLGLITISGGIASAGLGAWIVGRVATGADVATITPALWGLGTLVIVTGISTWLESWLAHDLAYRVLATLRVEIYQALSRLAPAHLLDKRSGDVVSAAMADVENLEWFYAHTIGALINCILVPAVVVVVLGFYHPFLPLMLLPLLALVATLPGALRKRAKRQGDEMKAKLGDLNAEVIDAVQGMRELTVFGATKRTTERLRERSRGLIGIQLRYGLRAGLENGVSRGFTAVGMLATLSYAAYLVTQGQLDSSAYPVTVILAGAVFGPVSSLSYMIGQFGMIGAAADRVFGLIDQEPAVTDPDKPISPPEAPLTVHFHGVGFAYEGVERAALKDVSFSISPGESVAIVGHSGAGKSTCARLLMRNYDPQEGAITLSGRNLRDMKLEDLRKLTALVPQEIYLLDVSLADNIRLGRPEATDREVEEAARLAIAHDFITALPNGYETCAGERGLQLSGGQRQRIAIARAFLTGAPVLILDEAASNLDAENEQALQAAIDRLRQDRTTLVIAHRLATVERADRIIVLEEGCIVEEGTPTELLNHDGPLSRLMQAQSEMRK